jgi:hypothetical protein
VSLQAAAHLGHIPWALTKEEEEDEKGEFVPYTSVKLYSDARIS